MRSPGLRDSERRPRAPCWPRVVGVAWRAGGGRGLRGGAGRSGGGRGRRGRDGGRGKGGGGRGLMGGEGLGGAERALGLPGCLPSFKLVDSFFKY